MNQLFRRNEDPAIARLIDPVRGFVLTCVRCNKHMKQESMPGHLCEAPEVSFNGVSFRRDPSMRYQCQTCRCAVPFVLVKAHSLRHPLELTEEEWFVFTVFQQALLASPKHSLPTSKPTPEPPLSLSTPTQSPPMTPRKRRCGEVLLHLRKVRKVQASLYRSASVFSRALSIAQKKAFRRWLKASGN